MSDDHENPLQGKEPRPDAPLPVEFAPPRRWPWRGRGNGGTQDPENDLRRQKGNGAPSPENAATARAVTASHVRTLPVPANGGRFPVARTRSADAPVQAPISAPAPDGNGRSRLPGRGDGPRQPGTGGGGSEGPPGPAPPGTGDRPPKPKLRKLRFALIMSGLAALAFVSTVFGMMMSVASDLPQLENRQQYKNAANSFLYDDHWRPIGIFAPPNNIVIDRFNEISEYMKGAVVAIEDRRFWTNPGVDIRGIARAFMADVTGGARQGASTIAQQFVKNALAEQNNRTVFEKLREAALAYHLTREWPKTKILTEYLNSIYFGNGAYGVESGARVYFGDKHGYGSPATTSSTPAQSAASNSTVPSQTTGQPSTGCGDSSPDLARPKCAAVLAPWEAALLAGMVANPSAFDPLAHPQAARQRRNLVLRDMFDQQYITRQQYDYGITQPLPTAADIQQPSEPTAAPYFTSWLRPQILAAMGYHRRVKDSIAEYRAYYGGLKIRTTLDLSMQQAAEQAIQQDLPYGPGQPTASLVTIDNRTGQVRAMVGGPIVNGQEDYKHYPFNLATEGHRQPGSSFKPFTLAMALKSGEYSPYSVIESAPQDFIVPHSGGKEHFIVHNFGNTYSGPITLTDATTISDNSVYSQVGIHVGPRRIARLAKRMGIRSPVSSNYAMILGGMRVGVTPLDMAHAYETFATGGRKVFDPVLGARNRGPTGIAQIQCAVCPNKNMVDTPTYDRILPPNVAQTVHDILATVVQSGTGTQAAIPGVDVVGKTGTTSNYADAWFVGWTPQLTTAVWVGFPDRLVPMATDYNGGPVEGGTYPAIIWRDFMAQAVQIFANEQAAAGQNTTTTTTPSGSSLGGGGSAGSGGTSSTTVPTGAATPGGGGGTTGGTAGGGTGNGGGTAGGGGGTGNGTGGTPGGGGSGGTGGGGTGRGTGGGGSGGGGSGSGTPGGGGSGSGGAGVGNSGH